jgi:uncharacterized protein (TIGR03067 family)
LFSLGSVLYALCAGRPPFRGDSLPAVLKKISEDFPRPLRDVNPDVPDWLAAIVAKLHARDPRDRFQSAKEVADLLGQHLAHLQQPGEVPMPAPVRSPGPPKRRGMPTWVIVLLVLLLGGVVLVPVVAIGAMALYWLSPRAAPSGQPQLSIVREEPGTEPPLGPVVPRDDFPTGDLKRMQGAWRAVSGVRQGKDLTREEISTVRLRVNDNWVEATLPPGPVRGPVILNQGTLPKQITIRHPTENDREMKGIYHFDDDKLVVCIGSYSDERPARFKTDPGKPSLVFVIFERDK